VDLFLFLIYLFLFVYLSLSLSFYLHLPVICESESDCFGCFVSTKNKLLFPGFDVPYINYKMLQLYILIYINYSNVENLNAFRSFTVALDSFKRKHISLNFARAENSLSRKYLLPVKNASEKNIEIKIEVS